MSRRCRSVRRVLAIGACARAGLDGAVDALLSGEHTACIAWSRASDAVRAEAGGDDRDAWLLTGRADPVVDGPLADVAIVPALAAGGPKLFAVSLTEHGRPAARGRDGSHAARSDGCTSTARRRSTWATPTRSPRSSTGARPSPRRRCSAARRACSSIATEYAKERVQFGRPIGSFQAVKHRCADMLVDVEGMRSTVYWAAWCIGAGDADASIAASTAKTWCSDASKRVMASGLQVHGGIGFTWEHDLHFFLKRAQLDQLAFGDAVFHRARLTELVRPRVEAGTSVV